MSELQIKNLIDLSIEDDDEELVTSTDRSETSISNGHQKVYEQPTIECTMPDCLMVAKGEGRESDNNPFDFVQTLSSRSEDPFDIVEKEACVKARYSVQPAQEVKVGKLLSISDDNIIDDDNWRMNENTAIERITQKNVFDMTATNVSSSVYHSALEHDLDNESPPVSMSIKSTPETCSSAFESDESSANSTDNCSAKIRKALVNSKRLLKLSIANSTFNSPLSCRSRQGESGVSRVFSAAAHFSDYILGTESPLKLVDDDLMMEEPPTRSNPENDFEADLKMLSIPMLRKLPSPLPEETSLNVKEANESIPIAQNVTSPGLSAIREKLWAKQMESCKGQNVLSLIDNLKSLLCENAIADKEKMEQANSLLKQLSATLNTDKGEDNDKKAQNKDNCEGSLQVPQTIVRQGTFDMELQPLAQEKSDHTEVTSPISADTSRMTHSLHSVQLLSPSKEVPDVMVKSSSTYDCEPIAERENLLSPHVDAISPITSPNSKPTLSNAATSYADVNDIIEQISNLLEQHQMTLQATNSDSKNGSDLSGSNVQQQPSMYNPTFIVVMPTNSVQSTKKQNPNISICEDFFEDANSNIAMRRRSQSLSLHDKIKILKLPVRPNPSKSGASGSPDLECVPQIDISTSDVKTPLRRPVRRNSVSSDMPRTPLNRGTSLANARRVQNSQIQSRHVLGPSKQLESEIQQQAVVHPIPRTNLNVFKPDLKKKTKQQTTKTSIMASREPLKAVIPIKKVAPMLTATMATPEGPVPNSRLLFQKDSMETSMHLLTKCGKMSNTSTPMPPAKSTGKIPVLPNACSTPAFSSAKANASGNVTKKTSMPTSILQQPFASTSGVKKRSLSELPRSKSPGRLRNSLPGPSLSTLKSRQPIKQSNVSKPATSRLSTRLNTRSSLSAAPTSTNKENKKP
ncbi:uncharacterized protein LOC128858655 [Anastrepha ludens]|uniref:uncharacterized protein LOC128858655 n=1 Tax=Anastrepha ludens TaxID=28586 RepID=UPI0023AF6296|nr:uncharacterized protein LOC128858655 [Anastrepha ludens]